MRILIRTSKWAIWARRFGSFALPLIVIPVWMHRNQMLTSDTFQTILAVAMAIAVLAVFAGLGGYIRLWQTGDRGWGRATMGIVLGLVCLSPLVYGVSLAMRYPATVDVTTDYQRPLPLLVNTRPRLLMTLPLPEEILSAFPNAVSRTYQLDTNRVFGLVEELILEREWETRVRRSPGIAGQEGQINVLAMTFFGWRDEVVIRVSEMPEGAAVAMRSTSLNGLHDLGRNGTRIESFLLELDERVSEINRDEIVGADAG